MKQQVLLLGGCCIDELLECSYLPKTGEDVLITNKKTMLGGSCLNVASVLNKLGKEPLIYSALGSDSYDVYSQELLDEGFNCSCIYKIDGQTGTCYILIDDTKERTFLTYNGVEGHFDKSKIPNSIIHSIDWIYLSGIFLTYADESSKLLPFLSQMIAQGKRVLFDLGSLVNQIELPILDKCIQLASIIKGNEFEIESMFQRLDNLSVSELVTTHSKIIIKTCGKKGSITYTSNKTFHTPSLKVDSIDTTGSGDNFVGALLSSLLDQLPLEDSIKIATTYGAFATTHLGGRLKPIK